MKQLFISIVCIVTVVVISGCSIARKVGAGVVLPFAAIGDTIVNLPLSGTEAASDKLIVLGDEHVAHVREVNKGKVTMDISQDTALVYYVPGYALRPIGMLAPPQLYPMTKLCLTVFDPIVDTPKIEDAIKILPRKKKASEEFEIW